MRQQRRRHHRLEYLVIPGLLFELSVRIDLPVMLDNLRLGALQDQLCTDILLANAGQCLSLGVQMCIRDRYKTESIKINIMFPVANPVSPAREIIYGVVSSIYGAFEKRKIMHEDNTKCAV